MESLGSWRTNYVNLNDFAVRKLEALQNTCFNIESNKSNKEDRKESSRQLMVWRVAGEFHLQIPHMA